MGWSIPIVWCVCTCVYLCTTSYHRLLGLNSMVIEHFYVFLSVPEFSVHPWLLHVSTECQAGSWGCFGVRPCMYVCVRGEAVSHCGPPARLCDRWGPLRQLRPTAHSDSVIMGGLLLWFTLTHPRTHTSTQTTQATVSCGLFPGCCPTRP